MYGHAAYYVEDVQPLFPMGARVRVNDDLCGGVGAVRIPLIPRCDYAKVGVEFDDAPGFVWQVERSIAELV